MNSTTLISTAQNPHSTNSGPFYQKHRVLCACRRILTEQGFLEVNTPALRACSNNVAQRWQVLVDVPFARIKQAYLKHSHDTVLRTLLRFSPRVFEIGACFRREPPDSTHNPEFLLCELAAVGIDFGFLVDTAKAIFSSCVELQVPYEFVSVKDAIQAALSVDLDQLTDDQLRQRIVESFPEYASLASKPPFYAVNKLISDRIEQGPGVRFLCQYPACTVCKAKRIPGTNTIYRFELFSDGLEIANAYLYEDDPTDYQARAIANGLNNAETQRTLTMLRDGNLPTDSGILGIGIERLCSAVTRRSLQDFVFAQEFSIL